MGHKSHAKITTKLSVAAVAKEVWTSPGNSRMSGNTMLKEELRSPQKGSLRMAVPLRSCKEGRGQYGPELESCSEAKAGEWMREQGEALGTGWCTGVSPGDKGPQVRLPSATRLSSEGDFTS